MLVLVLVQQKRRRAKEGAGMKNDHYPPPSLTLSVNLLELHRELLTVCFSSYTQVCGANVTLLLTNTKTEPPSLVYKARDDNNLQKKEEAEKGEKTPGAAKVEEESPKVDVDR